MFARIAILFAILLILDKTSQSFFGEDYTPPQGPEEHNRGYYLLRLERLSAKALRREIDHQSVDYWVFTLLLAHYTDINGTDLDEGATLLSADPLGEDLTTLKYLKIILEKVPQEEIDYLRMRLHGHIRARLNGVD